MSGSDLIVPLYLLPPSVNALHQGIPEGGFLMEDIEGDNGAQRDKEDGGTPIEPSAEELGGSPGEDADGELQRHVLDDW